MPLRPSLEAQDIEFVNSESSDGLRDCPSEFRGLFQSITATKKLSYRAFTSVPRSEGPVGTDPEREWRKELKIEACELTVVATDKRRADDDENTWVAKLEPIVFYRLIREQEENYHRNRHHHCFVCRKHFPMYGRPRISQGNEKRFNGGRHTGRKKRDQGIPIGAARKRHYRSSSNRSCSYEHLNIPNFDTCKPQHEGSENDKNRIPDRTIGLLSSNAEKWYKVIDKSILRDDRVRWFNPKVLRELEDKDFISPVLTSIAVSKSAKTKAGAKVSKTRGAIKRISELSLTFPFGIWEAKKPSGGCDAQTAQVQNSLAINEILRWQEDTGKRAGVPWQPLVWHFINIGAAWTVHACHLQQNPTETGFVQLQRRLWSGNIDNRDGALQLLYIVEIIALWGQHEYKPFAGACIHRLHAKYRKEDVPPLDSTLLRLQKKINEEEFPWLSPKAAHFCSPALTQPSRQSTFDLNTPWDPDTTLAQRIESMSMTLTDQGYIVPELDCFIWLLERDRRGFNVDCLVIRVDKIGQVQPPMVIFQDTAWDHPEFSRIVEEESERFPGQATGHFRYDCNKRSFIKRGLGRSGVLCKPDLQFCAIIPLRRDLYNKRREEGRLPFSRLEDILDLKSLIKAFETANNKWCLCKRLWNDRSPSMIQCDNLKCEIGWYHKRCAGLPEDYHVEHWFCKRCSRRFNTIKCARFDTQKLDPDILEASDARVQTMRTVSRIWRKHNWPDADRVLRLFDRISSRIKIEDAELYDAEENRSLHSRCCAISRNNAGKMADVRNFMTGPS